ncbi:MAG: DUF4142 domain-containing protein [Rhodospirillales bacterium]|nr:DUF4142 domain-containing protein [Rhodospirillales bacterium]
MKYLIKSAVAALSLLAFAATPASAGGLNDETIFAIFDQANMADIATGRLGWKKGQSDEVRKLAKMVVTDHSAVQQMGREVAKEMGILGTPPDGDQSWAGQAEALKNLSALSGKAFDEAYLRYEIGYHTAVIAAINSTLLPSIKNEKFKALVVKVLPGFEHHLAMTKAAADRMGVSY